MLQQQLWPRARDVGLKRKWITMQILASPFANLPHSSRVETQMEEFGEYWGQKQSEDYRRRARANLIRSQRTLLIWQWRGWDMHALYGKARSHPWTAHHPRPPALAAPPLGGYSGSPQEGDRQGKEMDGHHLRQLLSVSAGYNWWPEPWPAGGR